MTSPTGAIADRYDLGAMLGRGGSAAVYRGWDRALERAVAIKVLPAEVDPVALERRRRETRLLASLSHPALVTLYDAVGAEDVTYLVMELVSGGTLRGRIAREPLQADELAAVAADIAGALSCIHERGIIHRDITPANVLLTEPATGRRGVVAKLSDFGIAKLLETAPTRTTGIIGTARYLSPEQARGAAVGVASDVYAFGLCLIEACTGEPAFPGSPAETLAARLMRDPEVPRDLGYEWRSLLTAMTHRDPDARPTSSEVQARLQRMADQPVARSADTSPLTLPLPAPAPGDPVAIAGTARPHAAQEPPASSALTPRRRRGLVAIAAVAATLIAAAVVLSILLSPPRGPSSAERPASSSPGARPASTRPTTIRTSPSSASSAPASARTTAAPSQAVAPPARTGKGNGKGNGNGNGNGKGKGHGG